MRLRILFLLLITVALTLGIAGYRNARADPIVRRHTIALANWPGGAPPMRIVLVSDIHVAGPDMPPSRLARIITQINATDPDLILLAGDFTSDKLVATKYYPAGEALAPLAGLRARRGVFAVLGNHDHWRDARAASAALAAAKVRVLVNEAVRIGPIALGGVDDLYAGKPDPRGTLARMRALGGAEVMLVHSPRLLAETDIRPSVVLAGHTHCGQIKFPGSLFLGRYVRGFGYTACGTGVDRTRNFVVTAGLGTSIVPLRFNAPPDFWVVTLGAR